MKLTISEYYDDETGMYIATKYFVDGESITEDDYDELIDMLDRENEEDYEEDECDGDCDNCEYEYVNDQCGCPECTILKYVEQIQEITGGCPCCLEMVLREFMFEVIDHIVVED